MCAHSWHTEAYPYVRGEITPTPSTKSTGGVQEMTESPGPAEDRHACTESADLQQQQRSAFLAEADKSGAGQDAEYVIKHKLTFYR